MIRNERFPFEWKNPRGYVIAVIIDTVIGMHLFTLIASIASLGIGSYLLAIVATSEIRKGLDLINKNLKTESERPRAMQRISQFVHWHSILNE